MVPPFRRAASRRLYFEFDIDYVTHLDYKICLLAHEGRLPETILETEQGVASPGCGANRTAGGLGLSLCVSACLPTGRAS